jgi:hypothetical protein
VILAGAVRKKRPCSVCRRWFLPDVRVGARQRACGRRECQHERHRRAAERWRAANADYDHDRRWRESIASAKAKSSSLPPAANAPPPSARVPWDVVQDEMRVEGRVILAGFVRVIGSFVQDEIRRQVPEIVEGIARHPRRAVRDEIDPGG